jgi:hypothetical protein
VRLYYETSAVHERGLVLVAICQSYPRIGYQVVDKRNLVDLYKGILGAMLVSWKPFVSYFSVKDTRVCENRFLDLRLQSRAR